MNKSRPHSPLSILPSPGDVPPEGPVAIPETDGQAQFDLGQLVVHKLFHYRGVIFDVDATFQGSDDWYDKVAASRPPRDEPWYHVLVHEADHTTYVAERNLALDSSDEEIDHPLVHEIFETQDAGAYIPYHRAH